MKTLFLAGFSSILFLVGCSTPYREAPEALNFKKSSQYKLQALSHWQIISKDYANYLSKHLDKNKIYCIKYDDSVDFEDGFSKYLESNLVNKGFKVSLEDYDNVIEISSKLYKFRPKRAKYNNIQGILPLGAGVDAIIYNLAKEGEGAAASIVGIISLESFIAYNSKYNSIPQYEILLNARVYNNEDKILKASLSRSYYIADDDYLIYYKSYKYSKINLEGN